MPGLEYKSEGGTMARTKSPNYPAVGLKAAIELVQSLWTAEKRTAVAPEAAVQAMGYKGMSGPASTSLSALKKYGLVESDGNRVKVSQLAMRILHMPDGSSDR